MRRGDIIAEYDGPSFYRDVTHKSFRKNHRHDKKPTKKFNSRNYKNKMKSRDKVLEYHLKNSHHDSSAFKPFDIIHKARQISLRNYHPSVDATNNPLISIANSFHPKRWFPKKTIFGDYDSKNDSTISIIQSNGSNNIISKSTDNNEVSNGASSDNTSLSSALVSISASESASASISDSIALSEKLSQQASLSKAAEQKQKQQSLAIVQSLQAKSLAEDSSDDVDTNSNQSTSNSSNNKNSNDTSILNSESSISDNSEISQQQSSSSKPIDTPKPKPSMSSTVSEAISNKEEGNDTKNMPMPKNHFDDMSGYQFPNPASLTLPKQQSDNGLNEWIIKKAGILNKSLKAFGVDAQVVDWTNGPTVTQFRVKVHLGVKVSKIRHLSDDLKMALAAQDIRIEAPIPGKTTCGIEIPNPEPRPVMLSEVLDSKTFKKAKSPLTIALGVDLSGHPRVGDLRKMPHGLIAGATGSGKSVFINCMLISLLYKATPQQLRLILIDPKAVELAPYNGIPHLITPVISKPKQATASLHWCVKVMDKRYIALERAHVRNIEQYNAKMSKLNKPNEKMPYIVIVIDELADLMMVASNAVETYIVRITQKARAAGLHLIVATQRPSVDIVTGTIKNNIPTRIAFMVSSQVDSRTIIDTSGAEKLLGKGDMLYLGSGNSHPIRLQGCFVGNKEIDSIVKQVQAQAPAHYDFTPKSLSKKISILKHRDSLMPQVLKYISTQKTISTSRLQRVFSIGYNRSAKIIDDLQKHNFVSEQDGSKPREIYLTQDEYKKLHL